MDVMVQQQVSSLLLDSTENSWLTTEAFVLVAISNCVLCPNLSNPRMIVITHSTISSGSALSNPTAHIHLPTSFD